MGRRPAGQRAHGPLGAQHAGLRLVEQEGEPVRRPGGIQARALLGREDGVGDALRLEAPRRGGFPAVLAAREPGQPALDEQLLAALGLELAPQLARPPRRRGVAGVRAVAAADQARLAARAGRDVAGLELVHERDAPSLAREPPGERGAEAARAHDDRALHRRDGSGDRPSSRATGPQGESVPPLGRERGLRQTCGDARCSGV